MMKHNHRVRRNILLTIHLLASLFLGAFIYGEHFQLLVQFVFFPIVVLSGLFMWTWSWILKRKNFILNEMK